MIEFLLLGHIWTAVGSTPRPSVFNVAAAAAGRRQMTDVPRPPRRALVPGPGLDTPSKPGIAARAIAAREVAGQLAALGTVSRAEQVRPIVEQARAPLLPITGVGEIAKGIAGVMSEVGTIAKTGYNKFHNYHYATLQDLLRAPFSLGLSRWSPSIYR
jgi:hypothetical protein